MHQVYIGWYVLETSKLNTYYFFYVLKKEYGENVSMIYSDNDQLLLLKFNKFIFKEIEQEPLKSYFDKSIFTITNPCYSDTNQEFLGKFKNEIGDADILEAVCLQPKCNCISTNDKEIKCTAKGI